MVFVERFHAAIEAETVKIIAEASEPLRASLAASQAELVSVRTEAAKAATEAAQALAEQDAANAAALAKQAAEYNTKITQLEARIAELEAELAPPVVEPTPGLFFKLPDDIREKDRKVWAHYFGPYPRSIDNALTEDKDAYSRYFNNPAYTGGGYNTWGGYFRNRPLFRPQDKATNWKYNDCVFDVQKAAAAGVDGFFVDIMGAPGAETFTTYLLLRDAAHDLNIGFSVIPMIDANGNLAKNGTPAQAAAAVAQFAKKNSSYYLPDGRYVVSCFGVENKPLAWWTEVLNLLKTTHALPTAFISVGINYNNTVNYKTINYGSSPWGYGADPSVIRAATDYAAVSHARGEKFMAPVVAQDIRPRNSLWDEAANTEALRASWEKAIQQGADYAQIVTWSDYSENTEFAPSTARGYGPLDISSYYLVKWKTQEYPKILKDAVYLSHRSNFSDSTPSGPQTVTMKHWPRGNRSNPRDTVEALTFLTDAATVVVKVGANTYTYNAPGGMFAKTYPLAVGNVSVEVRRNNTVVAAVASTVPVLAQPVVDDKQYFWFSSVRGTAGQHDPIN